MPLCEFCSTIDFGRLFFGVPCNPSVRGTNGLLILGDLILSRDNCPLCSLICAAIASRYPLVPDLNQTSASSSCALCGVGDEGGGSKALQFSIYALPASESPTMIRDHHELRFNLVDNSLSPAPMRARNVAELEHRQKLVDMMKTWVNNCKADHSQCPQKWAPSRPSNLTMRLIDIKRWCLVNAPPDTSYAALSYAYSSATTTPDIRRFFANDDLKAEKLSATIYNAIGLAQD